MRAIPDQWLLVDVLRLAMRTAKGRHLLCDSAGRRCMWGEALSRLGVANRTMRGYRCISAPGMRPDDYWLHLPGAGLWDDGNLDAALDHVRIALRGLTVGEARAALRRVGWLPPARGRSRRATR